jgi:SAM-dependent methyltransferase
MRPEFRVLNVGAGTTYDDSLWSLRGEVQKVSGVDINDAVLHNDDLDEAFVIKDDRLPFDRDTFDLAWSDYVFEHVEKPSVFLSEIHRVLKPDSSFFFRTPNKYHYVSLIARLTPQWFHNLVANWARGLPPGLPDPYPTFHRLNSRREITKQSLASGFREIELNYFETDPSYLKFHSIPFLIGVLYERTVNRFDALSFMRANIFGRLQK